MDRQVSLSTNLVPSGDPIADSEAARSKASYKLMPVKLRAVSDRWRELVSDAENVRLKAAYQMSLDIHEVASQPNVYGPDAVERLQEAHGLSNATFREIRNLSRHFSREEFERILEHNEAQKEKHARFEGISLTHLIYLGTVNDAKLRQEVIEKIASEGLSTERTYNLLKFYRTRHASSSNKPVVPLKPTAAVKRLGKSVARCSQHCEPLMDDQFFGRLPSVAKKDRRKLVESLKNGRDQIRKTRLNLEMTEERFEAALAVLNGGHAHEVGEEESEGVVDAVSVAPAGPTKEAKPRKKKKKKVRKAGPESAKRPQGHASLPKARTDSGDQGSGASEKRRVKKKKKKRKVPGQQSPSGPRRRSESREEGS